MQRVRPAGACLPSPARTFPTRTFPTRTFPTRTFPTHTRTSPTFTSPTLTSPTRIVSALALPSPNDVPHPSAAQVRDALVAIETVASAAVDLSTGVASISLLCPSAGGEWGEWRESQVERMVAAVNGCAGPCHPHTCPFTPAPSHRAQVRGDDVDAQDCRPRHTCPFTPAPSHLPLHTCPFTPTPSHLPLHTVRRCAATTSTPKTAVLATHSAPEESPPLSPASAPEGANDAKPAADGKPKMEVVDLSVTGMTCAACVAAVERALVEAPGVKSATVSLLTHSCAATRLHSLHFTPPSSHTRAPPRLDPNTSGTMPRRSMPRSPVAHPEVGGSGPVLALNLSHLT